MSERNFSVRRFETSDVGDVVKLLKLVFERPFSTEWWNWKYRLNPAGFWGDKGDIWVAESANGEIIGHWAVMPEKIKFSSKTITVAQGVDAATHPSYRRLGINRTLTGKVFSDVQSRYSLFFGFPRDILYKYRSKHGWKCLPLPEFLNFLNCDRPLKSLFKNSFLVWSGKIALRTYQSGKKFLSGTFARRSTMSDVEIKKIDEFPDEIDDFWENVRSQYGMCIERTTAFLNWRFSRHFGDYHLFLARSVRNKNIVGYMVLKRTMILSIQNVLDIVDLQTLHSADECALNLIDLAITFARNERLDLVHCRVPMWHRYAKLLSKRGFVSVNSLLGLLRLSQPHVTFYSFGNEGIVPRFEKWFYTLADTDYA